ncbi:5224_t:CDS:2 [Funneliformis mosseae]|uniref:5224_t:CDS:1 n=1 Tax=Funneliformis mosseae TaxID=27381 RepID=A0A9N9GIA3_FUNMO|nr:5224_t:CDS:2 [Funneliformis mosseae]
MIPTFNLKDCGFKSEIKFTSFDVYYSDWENSINFYVQGVNSININQTKPIQFNSKLHYNITSRKSDIDRSCLKSKLNSNFGSRCQIEEDESTVTILTELTGTLDSVEQVELSVKVGGDEIGCVTASLESNDNENNENNESEFDKEDGKKKKKPKDPESPKPPSNHSTSSEKKGGSKGSLKYVFGGIGAAAILSMVALRKKIKKFLGCHKENTENNRIVV